MKFKDKEVLLFFNSNIVKEGIPNIFILLSKNQKTERYNEIYKDFLDILKEKNQQEYINFLKNYLLKNEEYNLEKIQQLIKDFKKI